MKEHNYTEYRCEHCHKTSTTRETIEEHEPACAVRKALAAQLEASKVKGAYNPDLNDLLRAVRRFEDDQILALGKAVSEAYAKAEKETT